MSLPSNNNLNPTTASFVDFTILEVKLRKADKIIGTGSYYRVHLTYMQESLSFLPC
jgi:hypothetical protein